MVDQATGVYGRILFSPVGGTQELSGRMNLLLGIIFDNIIAKLSNIADGLQNSHDPLGNI